jgi:hypothetical protein
MFREEVMDNNNLIDLAFSMKRIELIDSKYHHRIVLACNHYLMALKEIGNKEEDEELSYIRLVSAVEVLAEDFPVNDPLNGVDFSLFEAIDNGPILDRLRQILNVGKDNKTKLQKPVKKFILFIKKYSKGFFIGEKYNEENPIKSYIIFENDLEMHVKNIYNARSSYLHAGKSMFLSRYYNLDFNGDIDPVYGVGQDMMKIDFRKVGGCKIEHLLPRLNWFESLIRHCLLEYLKDKSREKH